MLTPNTTYEADTTCNYNGIVYRIGKKIILSNIHPAYPFNLNISDYFCYRNK